MKNFKKLMALVIAAVMVVGTMSIGSFAAVNDLTSDDTLTITGLDEGDTVNLYKVVEWIDGVGWEMVAPFRTAVDGTDPVEYTYATGCEAILNKIKAGTALTADEVTTLSKIVKGSTSTFDSQVLGTGAESYVLDSGVEPGMYIALVKPANADTLYNPIVVSSDFNNENDSNEIDSSASLADATSVVKKSTVTVEKTADDYTHASNDDDNSYDQPISFTITTTIPAYSTQYTAPKFNVYDKLSTGLELKENSITVSAGTVGYTIKNFAGDAELAATDKDGFKIEFTSADILALAAPQEVTITYQAYLTNDAPFTVNEEDNDVTVEFSNNPNNDQDVKEIYDKTRHYTFSIDGSVLFNSTYKTGEVVKVGQDSQGNVIESYKELSNTSQHGALKDAVFGLYTTSACDTLYTNSNYPEGCTVSTDENGLMEINGLDVGVYYLKEISAPNGYIKDQNYHTIEITADIDGDEDGETGEVITADNGFVYHVPVLRSYTVSVDGNDSTYRMTLDGPEISSVTIGDSSTEIINTKGVELPSTGGMGTTLFYAIGAILVLGAGVLLVSKRRMAAN